MALRAQAFDIATQSYLDQHPVGDRGGSGRGPADQFLAPGCGPSRREFRWLTVDLPPMIDVRTGYCRPRRGYRCWRAVGTGLQLDGRRRQSDGVFITAEGLLMYLQPEESLGLIAECAKRFPGGRMPSTCRRPGSRK